MSGSHKPYLSKVSKISELLTAASCACLGMTFDTAIRMYLESFRLPGEAQKINRIMETFGAHYHRQCPDIFRNADAVYVLAYSVIILNTDQHNNQVSSRRM